MQDTLVERRTKSQINRIVRVIRLRPFDTTTETGRSQERFRRLFWSAVAAVGNKAVAFFSLAVSVPLTVGYLGAERYGLWMTISSIIATLSFADLGISNALLTSIAEAHGRADRNAAAKYVTNAFFLLALVAAVLLSAFALAYPHVRWDLVCRVTSPDAVRQAGPAVAGLVLTFTLSLPLTIVQRVQTGYQEGYETNMWQSLGNILGLTALVIAIRAHGTLFWLVVALSGGPIVGYLVNWVVQFGFKRPWLFPRLRNIDMGIARELLGKSGQIMFAQSGATALFGSPIWLSARLFGAAAAGTVSVAFRLMTVPLYLTDTYQQNLWPAYGEALARRDHRWLVRTLKLSALGSCAITAAIALPLTIFAPWIIKVWTHGKIHAPISLVAAVALLAFLNTIRGVLSAFVLGCNRLRGAAYSLPIAAAVATSILFVHFQRAPLAVVTLWVCLCELFVIGIMSLDVRSVLIGSRNASRASEMVEAVSSEARSS